MRTESLILENLIYNAEYSSVVGIFLQPEYFKSPPEKIIFAEIQKYITEYNKPPSVELLSVNLNNRNDLNEVTFNNCLELKRITIFLFPRLLTKPAITKVLPDPVGDFITPLLSKKDLCIRFSW